MKRKGNRRAWLALGALLGSLAFGSTGYAAELSLQQAVEMALAQNTGLRVTQKAEDSAEASLREAKGRNGVSVSASDNVSISKWDNDEHTASNSLSLNGDLPLYTGGKNEANIESGKLGVDTARLKTERERENLKLEVIKAYYTVLEDYKTVEVSQETVDKYQAHLTNVQQLYSAGSKARVDVLRSEVELSNARQTLLRCRNAYEVDLANLRNLIHLDSDEPLTLTSDFSYDMFAIGMPEALAYAHTNRKDLLIDAYAVEQQALAVQAAKAGYLPTVNLSLGAGQSNVFHPSSTSSHDISAGLGVNWNIFDSGVTRAQIEKAETEKEIAELTLLKDQEAIDLELRQAYYNMREAEQRFQSTGDAVREAEENYYIDSEKYRVGEGLMLNIIDDQEALATAKLNYIGAQYDYARYKAEVENKMGIGLTDSERKAADNLLLTMPQAVEKAAAAVQQVKEIVPANLRADKEERQKARAEAEKSAPPSAGEVADEMAGQG